MVEFATFNDFAKEIDRIISEADERSIPLRILGGAAIRMHCPNCAPLYERLKRTPKHDMDFVTYSKFRPLTKKLFVDLGYEPYISLMLTGATGRYRQIFNDKEGNKAIDVFLDKLPMCHVIEFEGRLEIDHPTVPVTELLLQKAQVVQMNDKDWQDLCILLREHAVADSDNDAINVTHLSEILADDWGFYYTVTSNLNGLREYIVDCPGLSDEDRRNIKGKIDVIRDAIEKEPKTLKWKLRSKVGTAKKWYNVVEEVQRDSASAS